MGECYGQHQMTAQREELCRAIEQRNRLLRTRALADGTPLVLNNDLTLQQLRVLMHITKQPGISGNELGAALGVSAPTASGLVDRLVEKGLVERREDEHDRRMRRLYLTDEGVRIATDMDSLTHRLFNRLLPLLSTDDLVATLAVYDRLLGALDVLEQSASEVRTG